MNLLANIAEQSATIIGNDLAELTFLIQMGSLGNGSVEIHGPGWHTEYTFDELEKRLKP